MGEGYFLDIILLAMVAGFIFLRLRSVLGRRTGHERPPRSESGNGNQGAPAGQDDNVVSLPNRSASADRLSGREDAKLWADDSPIGAGLTQIKIADHSFDPAEFANGARAAYDMIVTAFAAGDLDTLKMLLNDEVFESFSTAIEERDKAGQTLQSTIVTLKSADIVGAELKGKVAEVTVKFVSDMISVLRGPDGEPMPGQHTGEREVTDIWTFARDTASRDPNWHLVETSSEN